MRCAGVVWYGRVRYAMRCVVQSSSEGSRSKWRFWKRVGEERRVCVHDQLVTRVMSLLLLYDARFSKSVSGYRTALRRGCAVDLAMLG